MTRLSGAVRRAGYARMTPNMALASTRPGQQVTSSSSASAGVIIPGAKARQRRRAMLGYLLYIC